ncbi:MAG: hypothetical protein HYY40_08360 [Bacteroidetes bacterium]|nr:hypothetical protein [Bacteroidota bacterium]
MDEKNIDFRHLLSALNSLEERISNIEEKIGIRVHEQSSRESENIVSGKQTAKKLIDEEKETAFESNIGSFGLALIGNIVLLFGIIFLWQYLQKLGFPVLSFVFGYISIAIILYGSKYLREKITHISFMFFLVGQFLLYFITLRLHFFSENPMISGKGTTILLLFGVIGYQVYVSIINRSQLYAVIALVMTAVTGLISETTYFMLSTATIMAAGAVFFFFRYGWRTTLITSIFLSYSVFIIWMFKNPELLNAGDFKLPHACNLFLISCAMAFSMVTLVPHNEIYSRNFIMGSVLLNGMNFSFVLMFFVFTFFTNNYEILFVTISIFCILFSIILQKYSTWRFSPAFYAIYGFIAISVSVYGIFGLPYVFLLLVIQSLLVLLMALWFRSRIIVGLNGAMLFILLITYLLTTESVNIINFSFALVVFITARVINFKKQLLNLETNYLRNMYLLVMFGMVLYSLHHALPDKYITLSWTIAAIVFFILHLILDNVKYRLMTIFAIISAAFRLFLVDLSKIPFSYRMMAFLFLAVISISVSVYFYRKIKKDTGSKKPDEHEKL